MNVELARDNERQFFVTALVGRLDLRTGELTYANAGHPPPLRAPAEAGARARSGRRRHRPRHPRRRRATRRRRSRSTAGTSCCSSPTASPRRSTAAASCSGRAAADDLHAASAARHGRQIVEADAVTAVNSLAGRTAAGRRHHRAGDPVSRVILSSGPLIARPHRHPLIEIRRHQQQHADPEHAQHPVEAGRARRCRAPAPSLR